MGRTVGPLRRVLGGVGLERMGLGPGRMPGDVAWRGRHVQVFVPLGTCLVLSVVVSVVMWVLGRLR